MNTINFLSLTVADTVMESYQPTPRFLHTSAQVESKIVVYSGRTVDDVVEKRKGLASIVEVFHPHSEHWEAKQSTGQTPAPGLWGAASAVVNDQLYSYGGRDGDCDFLHSLHQLSAKTYEWRELSAKGPASPMPKWDAAMVACGNGLALFGGYGVPHGPTQRVLGGYGVPHGPTQRAGSSFIKNTPGSDGSGWTNEFHIYHLNEGTHTCTTMTRICSLPLVVCCLGIHYPSSSQLCWL